MITIVSIELKQSDIISYREAFHRLFIKKKHQITVLNIVLKILLRDFFVIAKIEEINIAIM